MSNDIPVKDILNKLSEALESFAGSLMVVTDKATDALDRAVEFIDDVAEGMDAPVDEEPSFQEMYDLITKTFPYMEGKGKKQWLKENSDRLDYCYKAAKRRYQNEPVDLYDTKAFQDIVDTFIKNMDKRTRG